MLFNSFCFLVFLPIVFGLYWFLRRWVRFQNLLVVLASYVFYGWWDGRFLLLIAFTSAWSYVVGAIELRHYGTPGRERWQSKLLVVLSLVVNLGILGYFKYCDFFLAQACSLLAACGLNVHPSSLRVILPVGISFYTFQALSYTIDVYRRAIRPTRDPIAFFAFISFFPQLVAGPIERATNLLPQFLAQRTFDFDQAKDGCRQMLWGFFKKCVLADNCAVVANHLLNDPTQANGLGVLLGVFFFTLQIYGDFSGYSDIAIGCSKLFGIRLMRNFDCPYFARDIAEFWRRWHMSLTTWFRDYLYIPLGGSRCGRVRQIRNTFAIFLVSGFWHGANWTFLAWGAFHAALFLPLMLRGRNRTYLRPVAEGRLLPCGGECGRMLATFALVLIGWTFFRAQSMGEALHWFGLMCDVRTFGALQGVPREAPVALAAWGITWMLEWWNRQEAFGLVRLPHATALRWSIYYLLLWGVVFYVPGTQTFIYFQF